MNLRTKTMIIIGITLAVIMLSLNVVLRTVISNSFKQIEDQNVKNAVEQVLNALQNDISSKNSFVSDWAEWDETYSFFQDHNKKYIEHNLADAVFVQQQINIVVYFDVTGQMLYHKEIDLQQGREKAFTQSFAATFLANNVADRSLQKLKKQTSLKGLVMLPEGPLLMAAHSVVPSSGHGAVIGTMAVGYWLDDKKIKELEKMTTFDIAVYRFDSSGEAMEVIAAKEALANDKTTLIEFQDENIISGYTLLKDINDQPSLLVKISMPRNVYKQGLASLDLFMWSLLVVGIIFIATILCMLDRLILARLLQLDTRIVAIKNMEDLSVRIDVVGNDELSSLATSVNVMLDALEKSQNQLQRLRFTDAFTGLYNRAFFEQETQKIQDMGGNFAGAVIICDIDGLKFVNDTLGHEAGDAYIMAIATIIKQSLLANSTAFRIGGDEFAIIINSNTNHEAEDICSILQDTTMQYNGENPLVPLGLSIGCAIGPQPLTDIFKEADATMYRQKLNNGPNNRSAIVESLIKVADIRDCLSEGHGERVLNLVMALGEAVEISENGLYKLRVLAFFHDVGKVVIPEELLNTKLELLTLEEVRLIQTHCEIGKRIAHATPDLIPVADYILKHHEHWDGTGYPLGLRGDDIPLECRILIIADSYDVMTNGRSYRDIMTHEEAIQEIKDYAGTRYDPVLVEAFIKIMDN